jgi:hypothetical protein
MEMDKLNQLFLLDKHKHHNKDLGTTTNNRIYQNYELSPVFYNPYPEILYNFPISSNFLNNRYLDFTFIMQFMEVILLI